MEAEGMKCPRCGVEVHESWVSLAPVKTDDTDLMNPVFTHLDQNEIVDGTVPVELTRGSSRFASTCYASLMYCPRQECRGALFAVTQHWRGGGGFAPGFPTYQTERRIVYPWGFGPRRAESGVPEPYKRDFEEAGAILEVSPRMSAVLSRRLVADVLKDQGHYGLKKNALAEFVEDETQPLLLRRMADRLREAGNFGAHTVKDGLTGEIIDVDGEDAEFVLDVAEALMNHFIVTPAHISEQMNKLDEKVNRAGRVPLLGDGAAKDESR